MIDRRSFVLGAASALVASPASAVTRVEVPDLSTFVPPVIIWPGALSESVARYRDGLQEIADRIGPHAKVYPSNSGADGWIKAAAYCVERKRRAQIVIGHSNGVIACTQFARAVEPHGVKVAMVVIDKTILPCPSIGSNVVACMELWAGLSRVQIGDDFKGKYFKWDFPDLSHVGITYDPLAQKLAANFAKNWMRNLGMSVRRSRTD